MKTLRTLLVSTALLILSLTSLVYAKEQPTTQIAKNSSIANQQFAGDRDRGRDGRRGDRHRGDGRWHRDGFRGGIIVVPGGYSGYRGRGRYACRVYRGGRAYFGRVRRGCCLVYRKGDWRCYGKYEIVRRGW